MNLISPLIVINLSNFFLPTAGFSFRFAKSNFGFAKLNLDLGSKFLVNFCQLAEAVPREIISIELLPIPIELAKFPVGNHSFDINFFGRSSSRKFSIRNYDNFDSKLFRSSSKVHVRIFTVL